MKVCVSSSCRFSNEWDSIRNALKSVGIGCYLPSDTSYPDSVNEVATLVEKRHHVNEYWIFIDDSDILYVYAKDGYVGVSTAVEIGYAHAKGKIIVSSEEIEDFGIRVFVDKVMNVAKLTDYLKEVQNV